MHFNDIQKRNYCLSDKCCYDLRNEEGSKSRYEGLT